MKTAPIVIVGGGIGGVVLAHLLARGGKSALVIERGTAPPPFLRPEILWPPAAKTLFGIRERAFWERECVRRLGGITLDRNGQITPLVTSDTLRRAGVEPFITQPNNTREQLVALCEAEVRRGVEVIEFLRKGKRIRGVVARDRATGITSEIEAEWVVGDDGTESRVRAACGIEIELRPFPFELFVSALPWPAGWAEDTPRIWFPARDETSGVSGFGLMPMPGGGAAGIVPVRIENAEDSTALNAGWKRLFSAAAQAPPELRSLDFPNGFTRIHRDWGHARKYGIKGALLLGDALHPVSPAGGQGANMSIADAVALAEVFLSGTDNVVTAYESLRRKPNERGLRPTRFATRLIGWNRTPILRSLPDVLLSLLLHVPGLLPPLLRGAGTAAANEE